MKLKNYFDEYPINKTEFARMIGISQRGLYEIINEKVDTKLSIAIAISEMSDGKVKLQDVLPERFKRDLRKMLRNI